MARHASPHRHWPCAREHRARRPGGRSARLWRGVLLALVFSALHSGLLSAWAAWQGQAPWVQVCTAEGLRWVEAGESTPTDEDRPAVLQGGCVWTLAHLALPPATAASGAERPHLSGTRPVWVAHVAPSPDGHRRVLLMAPMRAPPARG